MTHSVDDPDFFLVQDSESENEDTRHSRKPKDRISWIGKPAYIEDDNSFYHAVNVGKVTYYLKEYIHTSATVCVRRNPKRGTRHTTKGDPNSTDLIGKIERLWETKEGEKMCQLTSLCVAPEDAPNGRRPYHGSKELVKKDDLDQLCHPITVLFDAQKPPKKIILENFEDFSKRRQFPDNVYYVRAEKLMEPKIEPENTTTGEHSSPEDNSESEQNANKIQPVTKAKTPSFDMELDSIATPSPSKRKNRRLISDEADYVAVKKENPLLEDETKPFRRLKRMKDLDSGDEIDPNIDEPAELVVTPRKKKRIILDSDAENDVFFNDDHHATRRSSRIPKLQERKHAKLRSVMAPQSPSGAESDGSLEVDESSSTENACNNAETNECESDVEIIGSSAGYKHTGTTKTEHGNPNRNGNSMSWIELSEQGKIAVPTTKQPLQFDAPPSTGPSRLKTRRAKQSSIQSFMTANGNPSGSGDDDDTATSSKVEKHRDKKKAQRSSTDKPKHSKTTDFPDGAFMPQLMFNDNDVDDNHTQHIKQQKLLHEFSRHSSRREESEGGGRWGRTVKRKENPIEDESEGSNEGNHSEYEDDDFLVADDAPIEQFEPSQDSEDDQIGGGESSHEEASDEEDFNVDKNDQDGLFEHVFTNKQAFIVFLQYVISASVDPDFIPMMIDAEHSDTYFKPALRKIRDLIQSRKTSLVQSSAWDSNFKKTLESKPYYASWSTQNVTLEDCHACLRANHPATFKLCLSGPHYNPEQYLSGNNLLDLPVLPTEGSRDDASANETEEEESESNSEDANYLLGRFCHGRTSLYHRLHFFHVHMFERVKKKVNREGSTKHSDELVQALLNNSSWVTEMTDKFSNLLMEADSFMNDSHEIM